MAKQHRIMKENIQNVKNWVEIAIKIQKAKFYLILDLEIFLLVRNVIAHEMTLMIN